MPAFAGMTSMGKDAMDFATGAEILRRARSAATATGAGSPRPRRPQPKWKCAITSEPMTMRLLISTPLRPQVSR